MKKLFFLFCLFLFALSVYAQDMIETKDGNVLSVRIIMDSKKNLIYYAMDDLNRVQKTITKKEIKKYALEKPSYETNVIMIEHDSISGEELYTDMIGYLINSGYEIEGFNQKESSVSTKYFGNHRITIIIKENTAHFQCFVSETREDTYTPESGRFYYGSIANEGEHIEVWKSGAFNAMDKLCRAYLLKNKANMVYGVL